MGRFYAPEKEFPHSLKKIPSFNKNEAKFFVCVGWLWEFNDEKKRSYSLKIVGLKLNVDINPIYFKASYDDDERRSFFQSIDNDETVVYRTHAHIH